MSRQAELAVVQPSRRPRRVSWAWLGVVPFFLFALLFLILPTLDLVVGAFQTPDGVVHARQHRAASTSRPSSAPI